MKQTAVEWLIEELRKHEFLGTFCTPEELENKKNHVESIIKQAKEMEKEQIFDALEVSKIERLTWGISKEQYYNETFKSE